MLLKSPKNIPCLDTQVYNCGQKTKVQPKAPPFFFFFFGHTAQLSLDFHSSKRDWTCVLSSESTKAQALSH